MSPSHRHPTDRQRGATLIEFALVLPLLLMMAFGTSEAGMAWVANNRVESATSTAARIGSSSGDLPETDRNVLLSLKSSLPQEQLNRLDRVVIFKSNSPNGAVPNGCIKAVGSSDQTGNSLCNTYNGNTVRAVTSATDLGTADDSWRSTTRNDNLSDPPDYIGVWIRTSYDAKTGTFFDDMTITKQSIYRIQPDIDG